MARRKKQRSMVFVVSVAAHVVLGAILVLVPQDKLREVVAIALNETKDEKKPEPPKPQPHAANQPSHPGHNTHPAMAAHAAAATAADAPAAFTDIGLALDSSSSDGIAVNIAPPVAAPAPVVEPPKPKVLVAHRTEDLCNEEIVKGHPITVVRPSYTDEARNARVGGNVIVELTVNEQGEVTGAKIRRGLGHGLDEAAIAAARRMRFSPAKRCGKPVTAPFVLSMRFAPPT